jgi:Protein of unknown function (DUF2844)
MKTRKLSFVSLCLGFVLTLLLVQQAQAALGESIDSLASDKKALMTVRSAKRTSSNYTVHELQSTTMTVREYVSVSGVIFGITWNGLTHPDLTPLLGNYASEHKKAASHTKRQPGRRYAKIKSDNIVVEKWGHMRRLQGRAYVPALIPEGVSVDEIK